MNRAWLSGASLFGASLFAACARPAAAPPSPAAGDAWAYEVVADDNARELGVVATFPRGTDGALGVDDAAARFVRDVEVSRHGAWTKIASANDEWPIADCAQGCSVRYRFALEEAANALDDVNLATKYDGAIESPPSSWLLRPVHFDRGIHYRFHVQTAAGVSFASGVTRDGDGTYGADVADLELAPYSVFGTLRTRELDVQSAHFTIAMLPGKLAMDDDAITEWVSTAERAVEAFYGRFPVKRALLVFVPSNGRDVSGKTLASGGATILLEVGGAMQRASIPRDWVLTHEMIHLALPSLARRHLWLEEGLATYVEPLARLKIGTVKSDYVWRGLVEGLPNGEPQDGDRGLDRTPTWGRTYWGGAMFCLMADIGIRKATANRHSLEDALRAIVEAGGNGEVRWSIERALAEGDRAIGVKVLEELYAAWSDAPVRVDLRDLWGSLGVRANGRAVSYDDAAADAAIRRAIAD